jgi:hypothetical protein
VSFIIHYLVRTALMPIHLNVVCYDPVSRKTLDSLYEVLARDATVKIGRVVSDDQIVIANIIPIPSGEPAVKQIGGL